MACHAPDREHGCCGSLAATLHTAQHVRDERARHPIQGVMAPEMGVSPPRCIPAAWEQAMLHWRLASVHAPGQQTGITIAQLV